MPPIRSSVTALRTIPATASGSRPPSISVRRVGSDNGWNTNMAASVRPSRQAVTVTVSPGVTVPPLSTDAYQRAQPGRSTWSMRFQCRSAKQSPIL